MKLSSQCVIYSLAITAGSVLAEGIVAIDVLSSTTPDYYRGEQITIICTATGFKKMRLLGLYRGKSVSDPRKGNSICQREYGTWNSGGSLSRDLVVSPLTDRYCKDWRSAPLFGIATSGTITRSLNYTHFYCFGGTHNTTTGEHSPIWSLGEIREPPGSITLTVSEPAVAEGVQFTFTCSSTGAVPASVYQYKILRDGVTIANTTTYVPVKEDRGGITLQCIDEEHANWRVDEDINKKEFVLPHYIESREEISNVRLNPGVSNTLTCFVIGYPVTYQWICNNCPDYVVDGSKLTFYSNPAKDDVSHATCSALVDGVGAVTQTWLVTWTREARTSSTKPMSTIVTAMTRFLD